VTHSGQAGSVGPDGPVTVVRRRRGGWLLWLPVLAFLLGVGLTVAVTAGLAGLNDVAEGGDSRVEPSPSEPAEGSGGAAAAPGQVPESCLKAAEYNETLSQALDELAVGLRDQDAGQLTETINTLQHADPESQAAAKECQALAGDPGADDESDDEADADEDGSSTEPTATPTP
jgi:hypothetical protein